MYWAIYSIWKAVLICGYFLRCVCLIQFTGGQKVLLPPPLCSVEAQFLLTGEPGLPAMPSLHSDIVLSLVVHTVEDFISFYSFILFFTLLLSSAPKSLFLLSHNFIWSNMVSVLLCFKMFAHFSMRPTLVKTINVAETTPFHQKHYWNSDLKHACWLPLELFHLSKNLPVQYVYWVPTLSFASVLSKSTSIIKQQYLFLNTYT